MKTKQPAVQSDREPETELVSMRERCATCAYRPGTEASKSELTLLKAKLCMETGEPFLCHEDPFQIGLCRGWVDALTARHEKGIPFKEGWKREIKLGLTELIANAEDGKVIDFEYEIKTIIERVGSSEADGFEDAVNA